MEEHSPKELRDSEAAENFLANAGAGDRLKALLNLEDADTLPITGKDYFNVDTRALYKHPDHHQPKEADISEEMKNDLLEVMRAIDELKNAPDDLSTEDLGRVIAKLDFSKRYFSEDRSRKGEYRTFGLNTFSDNAILSVQEDKNRFLRSERADYGFLLGYYPDAVLDFTRIGTVADKIKKYYKERGIVPQTLPKGEEVLDQKYGYSKGKVL